MKGVPMDTNDERSTYLGNVNVSKVAEEIDTAVQEEKARTSCDHVHPQADVHHPGGHPEQALFS